MMGTIAGLLIGAVLVTVFGIVIDGWIEYGIKNDLVDLEYPKDEDPSEDEDT